MEIVFPEYPAKRQSAVIELPWTWSGTAAVDGAAGDWAAAPLGSMYMRNLASNVALYIKTARTANTTDWHSVTVSA